MIEEGRHARPKLGTTGAAFGRVHPSHHCWANIYMRRLVLGWKKLGLERSLGSRIVTYADDLVILCRKGNADEALQQLRKIMSKLKLTVNEEKTRICKVPVPPNAFVRRCNPESRTLLPARRAWDTGHRRRASSAWSRTSTR